MNQAKLEREELVQRLLHMEDQIRELEAEVDARVKEAQKFRAVLAELDDLLGISPQLRLSLRSEPLRGRKLRDAAISAISERVPDGEVHYRQVYDWLVEDGYVISGKNPLANFLAQLSQDPRVEGAGGKSGLYRLAKNHS